MSDYAAMLGALRERDVRRAVRWLEQSGGLLPVPREAGDLLALRLAAERRVANRVTTPLTGAVVVLLGYALFDGAARVVWEQYGFPALLGVMIAANWSMDLLRKRADRRIVDALPRRVTRDSTAPLRVVLGPLRYGWMLASVGSVAIFDLLLLVVQPGWPALVRLVTVVVLALVVGSGLRSEVRRGAVALDLWSLIIDERLRTERAVQAMFLLPMLLWASMPHTQEAFPHLPDWLFLAFLGATVPAMIGWFLLLLPSGRSWNGARASRWVEPIRTSNGSLA